MIVHLDKSNALDASNNLDPDLDCLLDNFWIKYMCVEKFIAGFHNRLDKIASLNLDDIQKGYLLLSHAALQPLDKQRLVGVASTSYDLADLKVSLRN